MRPGFFEDDYDESEGTIPRAPLPLLDSLEDLMVRKGERPLDKIDAALADYPRDPQLLILASLACLLENRPDQSLLFTKRLTKYWEPSPISILLHVVALAQKEKFYDASVIIDKHNLKGFIHLVDFIFPAIPGLRNWVRGWIKQVDQWRKQQTRRKPVRSRARQRPRTNGRAAASRSIDEVSAVQHQASENLPSLPRLGADISTSFVLPAAASIAIPDGTEGSDWFRLRSEFGRLSLYQGFDELLCLPLLKNVTGYWYQIETVRKVLKNFRGRVLLADEVGLGKTIEAGMVLKEYMLRGMVERVLVLTPAAMVGQWLEEMETKFDFDFASTYDPLLRRDASAFWSRPRIIASIATARRPEHLAMLRDQVFDIVIVDEAHHLRNRGTSNWRLVDALQKRFLLLLSATPVQNNLVELYSLLTLLKPGIFKTEKEFRSTHVSPGKPRVPANRDRMRDLMRDVMIRNTRSQVDVRLPARTAVTLRVDPMPEEADCYSELNRLIRAFYESAPSRQRLALRHLLAAAGSSPAAAAGSIERFADSNNAEAAWIALRDRYRAIFTAAKGMALLELLHKTPGEKHIVFARSLETLAHLASLLEKVGTPFERFTGSMTGREKDAAISRFAADVPILLSTESGGEGRNLQFCNRLINFDLPWNPMAIEQRIGRLHRIGQSRDVFVFNLALRNTLEDHLIRILDEKINLFEMVVGEIGAILGEIDDAHNFSEMVFSAWVESHPDEPERAFDQLAEQVATARRQYEGSKILDENLFGDEFAVV